MVEDVGPKRKGSKLLLNEEEFLEHAKKFKLEEKSIAPSTVVVNHLGSVEVAKQPRRSNESFKLKLLRV